MPTFLKELLNFPWRLVQIKMQCFPHPSSQTLWMLSTGTLTKHFHQVTTSRWDLRRKPGILLPHTECPALFQTLEKTCPELNQILLRPPTMAGSGDSSLYLFLPPVQTSSFPKIQETFHRGALFSFESVWRQREVLDNRPCDC